MIHTLNIVHKVYSSTKNYICIVRESDDSLERDFLICTAQKHDQRQNQSRQIHRGEKPLYKLQKFVQILHKLLYFVYICNFIHMCFVRSYHVTGNFSRSVQHPVWSFDL